MVFTKSAIIKLALEKLFSERASEIDNKKTLWVVPWVDNYLAGSEIPWLQKCNN